jgi:hypothetical protein
MNDGTRLGTCSLYFVVRWSTDFRRLGDLTPRLGCDELLFTEREETRWTAARYEEYVAVCRSASRLIPIQSN